MDCSTKTKLRSKSSNNNHNNNKFLLCFRPVVMDNDGSAIPGRSNCPADPVFTYIAVGEDGAVFPRILPALPPEKDVAGAQKKKGSNRIFPRIMKAALFQMSLFCSQAKKKTKRKLRQESARSNSDAVAKSGKVSNSMNENSLHKEFSEDHNQRIILNASSSLRSSSVNNSTFLCSSCSSSGSSNSRFSRSNLADSKQRLYNNVEERQKGYYSANAGLCLLLTSLFVLIFWGKICAIFCTSTWLFFIPRWSMGHDSQRSGVMSPEIDSVEYKKKVIMEGLLERNRSRGL